MTSWNGPGIVTRQSEHTFQASPLLQRGEDVFTQVLLLDMHETCLHACISYQSAITPLLTVEGNPDPHLVS